MPEGSQRTNGSIGGVGGIGKASRSTGEGVGMEGGTEIVKSQGLDK